MNPISHCWTCGKLLSAPHLDNPDPRHYCSRACCLKAHDEGDDHADRLEAQDLRESGW